MQTINIYKTQKNALNITQISKKRQEIKLYLLNRDTKGTLNAKMSTIKDRNGIDLTEAEDIQKKRQNTQKDYTKIPIPKKGNAKECSNYHTIALISNASKVMLKILQA